MPGRIAHVFQIVMLSTGSYTFLRGHRPVVISFFITGKYTLELHHTGVGEQKRRIILGNKRRTPHDLVMMFFKIFNKYSACFFTCHLVLLSLFLERPFTVFVLFFLYEILRKSGAYFKLRCGQSRIGIRSARGSLYEKLAFKSTSAEPLPRWAIGTGQSSCLQFRSGPIARRGRGGIMPFGSASTTQYSLCPSGHGRL